MNTGEYPKLILLAMTAAVKGLRLYPPQHPEIKRQVTTFHNHLLALLHHRSCVRVGLLDGSLVIEDHLFLDDTPAAGEMAGLLAGLHLKTMEFLPGLQEEEVAALVSILGLAGLDAEALALRLGREGATHIRIIPEEEETEQSPRRVYGKALKVVEDIFSDVRLGKIPSSREAQTVVKSMVHLTLTDPHALFALSMLKDYDNYTFTHSVNVSVLALAVGRACGLNQEQLRILGLGGLLHDVGKLKVNVNIITKPGKLTEEEFEQIKRHPVTGAEIVGRMDGIPPEVIDIVYGHHLRHDRTGYPLNTQGREFSPLTEMAAIADTYDAITTLRSYQKPVTPRMAVKRLNELSATVLNPRMVSRFVNSLGRYPVGTLVRLDTNEIGLVIRVGATVPDDVQIKILFSGDGKRLDEYPVIELTDAARQRIVAEVDPSVKGVNVTDYFDIR